MILSFSANIWYLYQIIFEYICLISRRRILHWTFRITGNVQLHETKKRNITVYNMITNYLYSFIIHLSTVVDLCQKGDYFKKSLDANILVWQGQLEKSLVRKLPSAWNCATLKRIIIINDEIFDFFLTISDLLQCLITL